MSLVFPLKTREAVEACKLYRNAKYRKHLITVEPRFNEPLYNEVLGIYNERFSSARPKLQ